jgi:hypothetical protein
MAIDKTVLSEAVQLLNEIEVALLRRKISVHRQGSTRVLSAKVRRVRELLENERSRPYTSWSNVAVLLREAAKLVVGLLTDNIRYKFRPRGRGYEVLELGAWASA